MKLNDLKNISSLRNDMLKKSIYVYLYDFKYNDVDSTVLIDVGDKKFDLIFTFIVNNNDLLKLFYGNNKFTFNNLNLFISNFKYNLKNKKAFIDKEEWKKYIKEYYNSFYCALNDNTPTKVNITSNNRTRVALALAKRDNNENHIYCYTIQANGRNGERSPYNESLCKLMNNELYDEFKNERNISFKFSDNPKDEKSYQDIIRNYKGKRRFKN